MYQLLRAVIVWSATLCSTMVAVTATATAGEQAIAFEIRGAEFRNSKTLPADNQELGYVVNAWNSYQAKCDHLVEFLPELLGEKFSSFSCGIEFVKETTGKSGRRRYGSEAELKLNVEKLFFHDGGVVEGPHAKAKDFKGEHPWQLSREAARKGHFESCQSKEQQLKEKYKSNLVYFDCGVMIEAGVRDGWLYRSDSRFFLDSEVVEGGEK